MWHYIYLQKTEASIADEDTQDIIVTWILLLKKNPEDNCTSKSKTNSKLETNGKLETAFVSWYKIKCQFTYTYT